VTSSCENLKSYKKKNVYKNKPEPNSSDGLVMFSEKKKKYNKIAAGYPATPEKERRRRNVLSSTEH
jgi:hypothetical protein